MQVTIIGNGALATTVARACAATGSLSPTIVSGPDEHVDADLTIVAAEEVTVGRLLELGRTLLAAGRTALFITVEGEDVVAGPVVVPGVTACLECRLLGTFGDQPDATEALVNLAPLSTGTTTDVHARVLDEAAHIVADALTGLTRVVPGRRPFTAAAVLSAQGRDRATILPSGLCSSCPHAVETDTPIARAALAELGEAFELEVLDAEIGYSPGPVLHPDRYRTVGILGGGTAGYLAAMALRIRIPELDVTLIESSKIPIISVGEATTPDMVKFLHAPSLLGFDIVDFHRRVLPTFKLGVQFVWGHEHSGSFNYPFQYAPLVDAEAHDGDIDTQCVASLLMSADRAPVVDGGNGTMHSLLETIRFAYHLDNEKFVRFLSEEAAGRGIRHIDTTVASAVPTPDGDEIDHLVTEDGQHLKFDLYVDASGFRSVLMEGALGSPFRSFAGSLLTDSAIAANEPHNGVVKPYTRAETLASGWCWTIPFEESDHIGYVYSSAFSTPDDALAEMKRAHPGMGEPRHVRFRSGRHEHFFKGNVVAIGNAYAFVEPLESTALHMVIRELEQLTNHFPLKHDTATKDRLNQSMNALWDQLRWFLAIHYKFNRRLDTDFWKTVRTEADISGAEEHLGLFRERAPLSDRPSLFYSVIAPDFFSGDHAYDTLLMGQGVDARLGPPRTSAEEWNRKVALRRKIVERTIGQAEALPLLRDREPELLRRFVEGPHSWVHHWIAR